MRPKPQTWADYTFRVVRGPNKQGEWYWRATTKEDHKEKNVAAFWSHEAELVETFVQIDKVNAEFIVDANKTITLWDVVCRWMNDKQADFGSTTLESYKVRQRALEPFTNGLDVQKLTPTELDLLVRTINEKYSDAATNNMVRVLTMAWSYGVRVRMVSGPLHIQRVKRPKLVHDKYVPSDNELDLLEEQINKRPDNRWAVMFYRLSRYTGARLGEVADLNWSSVDLRRNRLTLNGKTGPRTIPIVPELRPHLVTWQESHPDEFWPVGRWSLMGFNDALKRAGKALGIKERITNHAIRRAFVRRLKRGDVDVKTSATWMGHSEVVMLQLYAETTDDDLMEAAGKLKF